jgi:hypothetical protein
MMQDLDTTNANGLLRNSGYRGERDPTTSKKDGFGRQIYCNGDMYVGEWENDYWNGRGRYKFANGRVFEGEFVFGVWQGSEQPTYIENPVENFPVEEVYQENDLGEMVMEESDDIEQYVCSDNAISAYATPSAVNMMQSMSQFDA